jgi:hypothetical protein
MANMKNVFIKMSDNVDINIPNDSLYPSFEGVRKAISEGKSPIVTYDLTVFKTSMLDKGYDVTIVGEEGYYNVQEILSNKFNIINKEMRIQHNLLKMFVADAFRARPLSGLAAIINS